MKEEVATIFMESLAIHSMILIALGNMLFAGCFLVIFGPYDESSPAGNTSPTDSSASLKTKIYYNVIVSLNKFGITFAAVGFGLFLGLTSALSINGYFLLAPSTIFSCFLMVCFVGMNWFFTWIVEMNSISTEKDSKLFGYLLIVATVALAIYMYLITY